MCVCLCVCVRGHGEGWMGVIMCVCVFVCVGGRGAWRARACAFMFILGREREGGGAYAQEDFRPK